MFFLLVLSVFILNFPRQNSCRTINNVDQLSVNGLNNESIWSSQYARQKRYIGLNKNFKINKRYQECISPGDAKGHCKHLAFCPTPIFQNAKNTVDYLCVIEKMHVGVCCPDDIALSGLAGSQIITDLPGGGYDYDANENGTGCGISFENRIGESKETRWPWMAALYNPTKLAQGVEQQFCGGAVITELHILSAAHCTQGLSAADIRVRLGEYDFRRSNETRSLDYAVAELINHEQYEAASYANDISIVRLARPTSFNSYIWPICLPPRDLDCQNLTAIVAGWGQEHFGGPSSAVLKHVAVPIWPHEQCVDAFLEQITDNNVCAADFDGGKDSCLGDSGGPLMYQLDNGRWVTIGIVSWGIGCGEKGHPGVYTKVSSYIPWIIEHTITKNVF